MSSLSKFFNFKAPVVYNLEHLDLVIEDKMLLLITWQFKGRYQLSIPTLKKKYRQRESAVLLKVPNHLNVVTIHVSTFWRKRKYKVVLKKLTLDEETSQFIIQQFKPFKMPVLNLAEIELKAQPSIMKLPIPTIYQPHLNIRSLNILPQNEKFIYPH